MSSIWKKLLNLMLAALIVVLVLLLGSALISKVFDESQRSSIAVLAALFAAVGTIGAVVWAIFHQYILERLQRPYLEVGFFEPESPHLRKTPVYQGGKRVPDVTLYPLSIRLTNTGKSLAKNAQPQITAMGRNVGGTWKIQTNWIPAPIRWGLDEPTLLATGRPTEEKHLIPDRPYFFNFGVLRTDRSDHFLLNPIAMPGGQATEYSTGEFCFELTVFAERVDPIRKYFHIHWDGGCSEDFEEVKRRVRIDVRDNPPW
jgi:hypothetical protein